MDDSVQARALQAHERRKEKLELVHDKSCARPLVHVVRGSRVWVVLVDDKPKLSFILRLHGIFCLQASRFIVSCACRRLEKIPDEGVDDEQDDEGNDA